MPSVITPCGGGGGGGGIQFDTTPQAGTFLQVTTSGYMNLETEGSQDLSIDANDTGNINIFANDGTINIGGTHAGIIVTSGSRGIDINARGGGNITIEANGPNAEIALITHAANGTYLLLSNLPILDPGVSGAVWNDSGTLKISP